MIADLLWVFGDLLITCAKVMAVIATVWYLAYHSPISFDSSQRKFELPKPAPTPQLPPAPTPTGLGRHPAPLVIQSRGVRHTRR